MRVLFLTILFSFNLYSSKVDIKNNSYNLDLLENQLYEKYLILASKLLYVKEFNKSIEISNEALEEIKDVNMYYLIFHKLIAYIYMSHNNHNKTLYHINKILNYPKITKYPKGLNYNDYIKLIVDSYVIKSNVLMEKHQYKFALKISLECLKKIKYLNISDKDNLLAQVYYTIGSVFYLNREYYKALNYFNKALNKNNLEKSIYTMLIFTYKEIIKKNSNIYEVSNIYKISFDSFIFFFGSIEFQKIVTLYFKALEEFKKKNFQKTLYYTNIVIELLNKLNNKRDKMRIKNLRIYTYKLNGNVYLEMNDINQSYISYKKAYNYSMELKDINLSHYINTSDYLSGYHIKGYYAHKYFYEEKYPQAFFYAEKLFKYELNISNTYKNIKELFAFFERKILTKNRYINNKSSFLDNISLILSISNSYQNSLTVSDKNIDKIRKKTFNKWINYKGIDFLQENKKLKNINYKSISKYLSKNQIYIDIASGSQNYYIFTLNKDNNITFEEFSKKETSLINEYIYVFRDNNNKMIEAMRDKNIDKEKLKVEAQKILSKLYDMLISKYLSEQIKDKKELIISPDGLLNFLPFDTLYHNGKYLIEDYNIKYISSGREFIRQIRRKEIKPKNNIIYFGSPDFNISLPISKTKKPMINSNQNVAMETWTQYKNFSPIGDEELKSIQKFYSDIKVYKGKNATVDNLMKIDSPKILHLSTHGKFLNNDKILNPMQKAGLAFVGANDKNSNMGIATALKLSTLNLQDTELVVLSACESGLGEIQKSEGVMGLPKAFFQAGARYVIMSLWSVSNQKTAELMDKFYKHLKEGKRYDIALWEAKLEMIKEGLHPYYWSAFIIHGI